MTIPKQGRRNITVDGTAYHYMVEFVRSGRMVIKHSSGRGSCLFVFPKTIMKPVHVADAIRFGLSKGWLPGITSSNCWIAFDADEQGRSLLEYIPSDDFRVITYPTYGKLRTATDD